MHPLYAAVFLWTFGFTKMHIGNKKMPSDVIEEKIRGHGHFWAGVALVVIGCALGW